MKPKHLKTLIVFSIVLLNPFESNASKLNKQSKDKAAVAIKSHDSGVNYASANAFFISYLKNYNDYLNDNKNQKALDSAAVDFLFPGYVVQPSGKLGMFETPEELRLATAGFLDYLKKQDVINIKWKNKDVTLINPTTAVANNVAILIKGNGVIYKELSSTYVAHFSNGNWKLIARLQHAPK